MAGRRIPNDVSVAGFDDSDVARQVWPLRTPGAGMLATRPIRVVGGATYPAELVPSAFARIYPAVADQDSLLGNARDTVVVTGGILQAFAYPVQALPWRVTGEIIVQYFGILRPGPGASLAFTSGGAITARNGGRLVARGTHANPVLFTAADTALGWSGITLEGAPSLGSYLTNARVEYASVLGHYGVGALDSHPLVIDSAVFRQNRNPVVLISAGSRISRSRVDTTRSAVPAMTLASNVILESTLIRGSSGVALEVASAGVQVLSCEIRGSGGAGIELDSAVVVHNCNLVGNAGPASPTRTPPPPTWKTTGGVTRPGPTAPAGTAPPAPSTTRRGAPRPTCCRTFRDGGTRCLPVKQAGRAVFRLAPLASRVHRPGFGGPVHGFGAVAHLSGSKRSGEKAWFTRTSEYSSICSGLPSPRMSTCSATQPPP